MERIAILDHNEHRLYIEDVYDDMLNDYNGEIQAYIDDNYDVERYSWDYITEALYTPNDKDYDCTLEIDFEDIADI